MAGFATAVCQAQQQEGAAQAAVSAKPPARDQEGISSLDIEQLSKVDIRTPAMNVEVTSVSKQESTVGRSPAAIYVITSEMIHRSACTNIPDLLRLVPGLEVSQVNSHAWAIASRGYNDAFSNKLLVLIDGRTVYSPLFNNVYWDVEDVVLEDIERIEVIRGPGGTLWGANAVNGVINIITKKAKDTQGALVTTGGGNMDRSIGVARVGGVIGENLHYRIYTKYLDRAKGWAGPIEPYPVLQDEANDTWQQGRFGFRADWEPGKMKKNVFTVQGDCYVGREGVYEWQASPTSWRTLVTEGPSPNGGNVLARWTHTFSEDSDWQLQSYFDQLQFDRNDPLYKAKINTFDVEFQHRFPLGNRHKIIWGGDYRNVHDDLSMDGFAYNFDPSHRTTTLFSMFVQDEIGLVEDRLSLTVGTKLEHNSYSGFECQPSIRLLYTPDQQHTVWGAISRAVRVPSQFEQDGFITFPLWVPTYFGRLQNNPDIMSEKLLAYEIGYRAQPSKEFSYDIALFYNVYEDMMGLQNIDPLINGNTIFRQMWNNDVRSEAYGVELTGRWAVTERWRLTSSYTLLKVNARIFQDTTSEDSIYRLLLVPRNQVQFQSSWDLGSNWQFDTIVRYVDQLFAEYVPQYIMLDLRLAWAPNKRLEMAVIGRNLLNEHHLEYVPGTFTSTTTSVRRSVYGQLTWRY